MAFWGPPTGNLLQAMDINEAICNGIWNNILTGWYFRDNQNWIVMPEYVIQSSPKLRPDLLICDRANWPACTTDKPLKAKIPTPTLVFEGKFTGQTAKFDTARAQALGYMAATGCKLAMVALGRRIVFTTPSLSGKDDRCVGLNRDGTGFVVSTSAYELDINDDYRTICTFLALVAARTEIPKSKD